ncbi:hypothetical protein GCM10010428_68990 [Actinosynnema pretiosum subsp. pretiosum]
MTGQGPAAGTPQAVRRRAVRQWVSGRGPAGAPGQGPATGARQAVRRQASGRVRRQAPRRRSGDGRSGRQSGGR